jgi:hypothetical protein
MAPYQAQEQIDGWMGQPCQQVCRLRQGSEATRRAACSAEARCISGGQPCDDGSVGIKGGSFH